LLVSPLCWSVRQEHKVQSTKFKARKGHRSFFATSFRLNILNMRSVITNPPTTFVLAQTTATNPRIVLVVLCPAPAVTIDPTSEMPEIAFVADINGVCNRGGTREIT
jgi:hypothetical protein